MMIETHHCIKFHAFYKTVEAINKYIGYIHELCKVNNSTFNHSCVDPGVQKFEIYASFESDIIRISDVIDTYTPKSIRITQ
jgi:hypothetical protein